MTTWVTSRLAYERLSRASRQQWLLRTVAGLAGPGLVGVLLLAGGTVGPLVAAGLLALSLLVVLLPDSEAALALVLASALAWVMSVPDELSLWTLVAALDLLLLHVAATLASHGPPQLVLSPDVLWLWARRAAVLASATGLAWLAGILLEGLDLTASSVATALALSVMVGWVALLWVRMVTRDAEPPE